MLTFLYFLQPCWLSDAFLLCVCFILFGGSQETITYIFISEEIKFLNIQVHSQINSLEIL